MEVAKSEVRILHVGAESVLQHALLFTDQNLNLISSRHRLVDQTAPSGESTFFCLFVNATIIFKPTRPEKWYEVGEGSRRSSVRGEKE